MSLRATTWALYEVGPEVADPYARLMLLVLADHADHDGRGAGLSKATLARFVGCGETTVYRRLRALERDGLIVRGDQGIVAYLPADKRPTVWDLPLVRGASRAPRKSSRGASRTPRTRGASGVPAGCQRGATAETRNGDSPEPLEPAVAAAGEARPAAATDITAMRHALKDRTAS